MHILFARAKRTVYISRGSSTNKISGLFVVKSSGTNGIARRAHELCGRVAFVKVRVSVDCPLLEVRVSELRKPHQVACLAVHTGLNRNKEEEEPLYLFLINHETDARIHSSLSKSIILCKWPSRNRR